MDAPAISVPLVDIGVNLTDKAFDDDRIDVIERARKANVTRMVLTGTSVNGSRKAAALAQTRPGSFFATAGVHPHDAKSFTDESLETLRDLAAYDEVVAIGECGLDYNRDFSPRPDQRVVFRAQVELAIELEMPLFVHERDAADDLLRILDDQPSLPRLVVHCFTGSAETLAAYVERDFYIGITGWICDERRGEHLIPLIKTIPSDRLMLETDAPYLLPRTIRPKPKSRRNEPAYLPYVADAVARALEVEPDEVAARTTHAAEAFFGLRVPALRLL